MTLKVYAYDKGNPKRKPRLDDRVRITVEGRVAGPDLMFPHRTLVNIETRSGVTVQMSSENPEFIAGDFKVGDFVTVAMSGDESLLWEIKALSGDYAWLTRPDRAPWTTMVSYLRFQKED